MFYYYLNACLHYFGGDTYIMYFSFPTKRQYPRAFGLRIDHATLTTGSLRSALPSRVGWSRSSSFSFGKKDNNANCFLVSLEMIKQNEIIIESNILYSRTSPSQTLLTKDNDKSFFVLFVFYLFCL